MGQKNPLPHVTNQFQVNFFEWDVGRLVRNITINV